VTLRERAARCLAADEVGLLVRREVEELSKFLLPGLPVNDRAWQGAEDVVLVNGRWLAPAALPAPLGAPEVGLVGGQVAYVSLTAEQAHEVKPDNLGRHLAEWKDQLPGRPAGGVMIDRPWDLVENNARALLQDEQYWSHNRETVLPAAPAVQGPRERLLVAPSARVEALVLIDTTKGPVIVDDNVVVQAFSRLEGPCYLGPNTQVFAGRIKGGSVGPQCRIGGEVEASIVHGHSNKAHEGFLGHSYVGEWVNLGSGTQTSDLRNDYGDVDLVIGGQKVETGLIKVGSFIGDHTKTSINTLFNTGSVCGPFGMLVTNGALLPRSLPAFCQVHHGRIVERTDLGQMFAAAATMMSRRCVEWTEAHGDFFLDLFERTSGERQRFLQEREGRSRRVM
jgi:UDP-N-acetylglucosamine diphosphorylase/glucosamine-1-phosphate N-acetyltransferase